MVGAHSTRQIRRAASLAAWRMAFDRHGARTGSMSRLSEDDFQATFDAHPVAVGQDDEPPFDFWPYVDAISNEDCNGHDFSRAP
jgi:hypothetical protein